MNINEVKSYQPDAKPRVVISGGGTGGHIYPALSIAQAVKRRYPEAAVLFVGAIGRMEMEKVPQAGFQIIGLPVRGLDRKRLWRNFAIILRFLKAKATCRRLIKEFKPDVAIGVGGYASAPTLKAAQAAGVPTIIQEQNSYPGVTNKMLAKRANFIDVAYQGLERFFPANRIVLTGNPIREQVANIDLTPQECKAQLGFDPDKPLVLAVGGSLGARTINRAMQAAAPELAAAGVQLLWQTGRNWEPDNNLPDGVKQVKFINGMAQAYRAADLVVARAGACTISELQLLGKPSILVPSPNVAEDHQRHNAMALVDAGAAVMVLDSEAQQHLKPQILDLIANSPQRNALGRNAKEMALTNSADKIVDQISQLINP